MSCGGPETVLVGITSLSSILTIVISRVRCICRPCSDEPGERFVSGCTDQPLQKPDQHEIDLQTCDFGNGKTAFVISSRE